MLIYGGLGGGILLLLVVAMAVTSLVDGASQVAQKPTPAASPGPGTSAEAGGSGPTEGGRGDAPPAGSGPRVGEPAQPSTPEKNIADEIHGSRANSDTERDERDPSSEELEDRFRPRRSGKRVPIIDFNPARQSPPTGYSVELFIKHYQKYRHDPERCVRDIGYIVTYGDGSTDEISVFQDAASHWHPAVRAAGATGLLNYRKQVDTSFRQLFMSLSDLQKQPDRAAAGVGLFAARVVAGYGDELLPPTEKFLAGATDPLHKLVVMRFLGGIAQDEPAGIQAIIPFLDNQQLVVAPNGSMTLAKAAILSLALAGKNAEPAIPRLQELADDPRETDSLRREAAEAIQIIRGNKPLPFSANAKGTLLEES